MKTGFIKLFLIIGLYIPGAVFLGGAADKEVGGKNDVFMNFSREFRIKAERHEKRKQWVKALQKWEIVRSFLPKDEYAYDKVIRLRKKIKSISDRNFRQGVSDYLRDNAWKAFKNFVRTLSYDPDNQEALDFLKTDLLGKEFTEYEVQPGDTLRTIAEGEYQDSNLDFVISYFNNLPRKVKKPTPGVSLQIPVLVTVNKKYKAKKQKKKKVLLAATSKDGGYSDSEEPADEMINLKAVLKEARKSFKSKKCAKTINAVEKILEEDPSHEEGQRLLNSCAYSLGKSFEKQNKPIDAVETYRKSDPSYKDVKSLITRLETKLKKGADVHYNNGVQYFTKDDYPNAIKEWEQALRVDPGHAKAQRDLLRATKLMEKLKQLK